MPDHLFELHCPGVSEEFQCTRWKCRNIVYDDILWQGDLNWDMSRETNFAMTMKRFVSRVGLVSLWDRYQIDYTHIHTDSTY